MKIAVIGAGVSGAAFYDAIDTDRHEVSFFDKGRGIGGRMSRRLVDGIGEFDHGAQFFTARDKAFKSVIEQATAENIVEELSESVAYYRGEQKEDARASKRYFASPASELVRFLLKDASVRSAVKVTNIEKSGDQYVLTLDDTEKTEAFDLVVISAPGPQAIELCPLEERPSHLSLSMESCFCTMLGLSEGSYRLQEDAAFVSGRKLSWFASNTRKGRRTAQDCITLHGSAAFSERYTVENKLVLEKELVDDFLDLSGISRDDITYKASHFWRYAKPEQDDIQNEGFYLSPSNKLAFIGDYLMGGRVEGAFLSGRNLATSINRLGKV